MNFNPTFSKNEDSLVLNNQKQTKNYRFFRWFWKTIKNTINKQRNLWSKFNYCFRKNYCFIYLNVIWVYTLCTIPGKILKNLYCLVFALNIYLISKKKMRMIIIECLNQHKILKWAKRNCQIDFLTKRKNLSRVSIRKTFAQFLRKKVQIFAFVALYFCAKKIALCAIIRNLHLRYSVFRNFVEQILNKRLNKGVNCINLWDCNFCIWL